MSWQVYVDDHLLTPLGPDRALTSAAIIGVEGSVWAQSKNFPPITPEEITKILEAFDDSTHIAQTGLFVGGAKYFVLQGEQGVVIRGKKGSGGITIKKTGLALVMGIYDEPVTPPECNTVVEKLGDYLVDQGY